MTRIMNALVGIRIKHGAPPAGTQTIQWIMTTVAAAAAEVVAAATAAAAAVAAGPAEAAAAGAGAIEVVTTGVCNCGPATL